MATILEFRGSLRNGSRSAAATYAAGEIVLFPGVRYEYHVETAAAAQTKPRRKSPRKRDKLVIQD